MTKKWKAVLVLNAVLLLAGPATTQDQKEEDVWKPFRFFVGSWEGAASGRFGKGKVEAQYEFVLDNSFLRGQHKTVYEPRERYPQGEIHQEVSFFSLNRATNTYVLRQFHNESIVNEYLLDHISDDGKTIVMRTQHVENFRPGWRARETYKILGPDEFLEVFELAAPGKEFQVFVQNHFKRKM